MSLSPDILLGDDEEPGFDWKDSESPTRLSARHSLELYLERKALRRRLEDTFDEAPLNDGEWDWH
ncbi:MULTISPECIES: PA3496 family putative envelope integrity protein [unclassified Ectothiorhodospira]|jgi:hypothetical protein|uniref:PA3496 family putative envelope integrity protein n=1 Tax=unclassified Ectothiorhodospira TaxID=2684909 RepID=UPI001EE7B34E|nr:MULTISPECIES: hypothetical protein [unclassified Ectothiorhodospira]MCG5516017.1 hypothetical protein [Ectothiorhodospira sp. 9100]MCG5519075.1 hypothetical protein [Ectothiorhodospira sp. 9905]